MWVGGKSPNAPKSESWSLLRPRTKVVAFTSLLILLFVIKTSSTIAIILYAFFIFSIPVARLSLKVLSLAFLELISEGARMTQEVAPFFLSKP